MDINELASAINKLQDSIAADIPRIQTEINQIIDTQNISTKYIERTLDTLLDYMQMGQGKKEFLKLNGYYMTLNPEYAKEYRTYYKDIHKDME